MDRLLFCEAGDCPSRLIVQDDKEGWIYYMDEKEEYHYYHYECFEMNEMEVINNAEEA